MDGSNRDSPPLVIPPEPLPVFVPAGTPLPELDRIEGRVVRFVGSTPRRVAARLIDYLVSLSALVGPGVLLAVPLSAGFEGAAVAVVVVGGVVAGLAAWFFVRVARIALWGCTVGQRIAGLRVVRLGDGDADPTWGEAAGRAMPVWGGGMDPAATPFGDLIAYWKDKQTRRCLHDRDHTVVVRARQTGPAERVRRVLLAVLAAFPLTVVVTVVGVLS